MKTERNALDPRPSASPEATREDPFSVPWTVGDIFWAIASILLLEGLFVLAVLALWAVVPALVPQFRVGLLMLGSVFVQGLLFQVAWQFTVVKYRCHWEMLGLRPFLPMVGFLLIWAVVVAGFAAYLGYASLTPLLHIDFQLPTPFSRVFSGSDAASVAVISLAVFIAPAAEEVFFRGFVFSGLSQSYGIRWGALGSSALFALSYLDFGALIPIFLLGVLLCWLYIKSQSIWPCMMVHLIYGATGVMMPFALNRI